MAVASSCPWHHLIKPSAKERPEPHRITIEPDVVHCKEKERYLGDSNTRGQSPTLAGDDPGKVYIDRIM
jgi:hypothetical protein